MSDKDNPFGPPGGDRTVFQPNPGGRRPPPRPAAPPPPAPTPGYTPQTAPAYAPQPDFGAPRPAENPYGQFAPSPFETASAPRAPAPDAWVTGRGQQQQTAASLQRAEDLDFDALVAQHPNPILRAAGPLLHLLGRLRVAALSADLESLLEQVAAAVAFFDKDIRSAGVTPEQANVAKYLICATADDIVQNIPTDDRHLWTRYSMTSRFFGERLGGVNFFKQLEWLQRDPGANFDVLELQHVCLALGFQGQYRAAEGGPNQLQYIQRNLYELLRRVRPKQALDLSPRWKGQALPLGRKGFVLPVWATAAVAALLLFGLFIGLRAKLGGIGKSVAAEIETLHPSTKIALQERLESAARGAAAETLRAMQAHRRSARRRRQRHLQWQMGADQGRRRRAVPIRQGGGAAAILAHRRAHRPRHRRRDRADQSDRPHRQSALEPAQSVPRQSASVGGARARRRGAAEAAAQGCVARRGGRPRRHPSRSPTTPMKPDGASIGVSKCSSAA